MDYAVVHLDRPVVGRTPIPVQTEPRPMNLFQNLTVVGYGSGIPAKVDMGGIVVNPREESMDYFLATSDTFGESSSHFSIHSNLQIVPVKSTFS
jgi:hypothetical protein